MLLFYLKKKKTCPEVGYFNLRDMTQVLKTAKARAAVGAATINTDSVRVPTTNCSIYPSIHPSGPGDEQRGIVGYSLSSSSFLQHHQSESRAEGAHTRTNSCILSVSHSLTLITQSICWSWTMWVHQMCHNCNVLSFTVICSWSACQASAHICPPPFSLHCAASSSHQWPQVNCVTLLYCFSTGEHLSTIPAVADHNHFMKDTACTLNYRLMCSHSAW